MSTKRFIAIIICGLMALSFGCSKKNDVVDVLAAQDVTDVTGSASADGTGAASVDGQEPAGETASVPAQTLAYKITGSVAYVFSGTEGATLYGAVEYQNTGSTSFIVESAAFSFSVDGAPLEVTFSPMLNQYDIIEANQSSFLALWHTDAALTAGASAELTGVELTVSPSSERRRNLSVSDIYLADNYPGFTTLSGTVMNLSQQSCSFNVVYTGFYDETGSLLGVWYFTKNVYLEQNDDKAFVMQMRELPIPDLEARCTDARGVGFGFD